MPWSIEKRGDEYCVVKDSDGETEGCHDSRAKAEAQRRALYASESSTSAEEATVTTVEETSITFATPPPEVNEEAPNEEVSVIWEGVLAFEGKPTDDRRYLMPGEIRERELPLSLMVQTITAEGHAGAELGGKITEVWREETSDGVVEIWGRGPFDSSDFGQEAGRLVEEEYLRGVSVDLAISEVIPLDPETFEPLDMEDVDPIAALFGGGDQVMGIKGTILGATLVPFPAFEDANVSIAAPEEVTVDPRLSAALDRLSMVTQKERFEGYRIGMDLGILTLNDVLAAEGRPPIEGGDVRFAHREPVVTASAAVPVEKETVKVIVDNGPDRVTETVVHALDLITERLAAGEKLNESMIVSLRALAEMESAPPVINVEPQINVPVPEVNVTVEKGPQNVTFQRDTYGRIVSADVEEA